MIRNMQIRSKLIAVLLLPLVALAVLAAIGVRANVSRGVQADRVNDQRAFATRLSSLAHEMQRERDLSAAWVGTGRDAGYGGVVAQRVAGNEALRGFRRDAASLDAGDDSLFGRGVETAVRQFNQFDTERRRIEQDPSLTVERTLDIYSSLIANLLAVQSELGRQTNDRNLI